MIIQITESKKNKLAGYTEEILRLAGKMMQCVENLDDPSEDEMGERSYRSMGMRESDDYDRDDMGMRSRAYGDRRDYRGRYMRSR